MVLAKPGAGSVLHGGNWYALVSSVPDCEARVRTIRAAMRSVAVLRTGLMVEGPTRRIRVEFGQSAWPAGLEPEPEPDLFRGFKDFESLARDLQNKGWVSWPPGWPPPEGKARCPGACNP